MLSVLRDVGDELFEKHSPGLGSNLAANFVQLILLDSNDLWHDVLRIHSVASFQTHFEVVVQVLEVGVDHYHFEVPCLLVLVARVVSEVDGC